MRETFAVAASVGAHALRARVYRMGGVSGGNSVFCSRWGCGYCGLHKISTSFYLSACYKIAKYGLRILAGNLRITFYAITLYW